MAEFVSDCPRCEARSITFDILGDKANRISSAKAYIEALAACRHCDRCSVAKFRNTSDYVPEHYGETGTLSKIRGSVKSWYTHYGFVAASDIDVRKPPEDLPEHIAKCFVEGAAAFSVRAYNASAAMFRLCLDLCTKDLLPNSSEQTAGPNSVQRKRLYDRLNYLFDAGLLPSELRDLADCVREDGNDGAHDGTLSKEDAEDIIDFAEQIFERVYTEPARLQAAKSRRDARRGAGK